MKTNKIEMIIHAIYKSGRYEIYFSDIKEIIDRQYFNTFSVTKNEFLTAIKEFAEYNYNLLIGGRKSKNPGLILYGNMDSKRKNPSLYN